MVRIGILILITVMVMSSMALAEINENGQYTNSKEITESAQIFNSLIVLEDTTVAKDPMQTPQDSINPDLDSIAYEEDSIKVALVLDTSNISFKTTRALSEINVSGSADAYPWISGDGLHLYYTKGKAIYYAEREHIDSLFEAFKMVKFEDGVSETLSQWLTKDEGTIYFMSSISNGSMTTTLNCAHRSDTSEVFSTPEKITILGELSGFLSGASLTEDLEQLFMYNNDNGNEQTCVLQRTDSNEYTLIDSLPLPEGYVGASPGQLSSDGLKYYVSLEYDLDASYSRVFHYYERETIEESFSKISYVNDLLVNNNLNNISQVSAAVDENCIVFTRGTGNIWDNNELYIAYRNNDITSVNTNRVDNSNVVTMYPNPASDFVYIALGNKFKNEECMLSIYNYDGTYVESLTIPVGSERVKLSTEKYSSGIYLYKVEKSKETIAKGSFFVKH